MVDIFQQYGSQIKIRLTLPNTVKKIKLVI